LGFSQIEYGRRKGIGLLEFAFYTMTRGQGVSHYTTRNSAGRICSSERKGYAAPLPTNYGNVTDNSVADNPATNY
jgi:hypothetical protein